MLSNLIITSQRLVVVIDELGQEKIAHKSLCQLLREQGQDELTIKILPLTNALNQEATFEEFFKECSSSNDAAAAEETDKWNILLPVLSDLLCYQRPAIIFQFVNKLRKCAQVKRIFLWASTPHLMHEHAAYVLSACEHMADLVVHLHTSSVLSIVTRKPGGGITNKRYNYTKAKNEFLVTPESTSKSTRTSPEQQQNEKPEPSGSTFKIELDEDEVVARNAVKLPYEKTSESVEGNIVYSPDEEDDFDDEDPDEDLCI